MTTRDILFAASAGATPPVVCTDISLTTYAGNPYPVLNAPVGPSSLVFTFSSDGTKLFTLESSSTEIIKQYTLSTPYAIGTATYSGISVDVTSLGWDISSILISQDGLKMYLSAGTISSINPSQIWEFDLPTPNDISTLVYNGETFPFINNSIDGSIDGSIFGNNGSKFYLKVTAPGTIYQYSLSTPYDITTATYDSVSLSIPAIAIENIQFDPSGSILYLADSSADGIWQYSVTTPWDLSTAVYNGEPVPRKSINAQDSNPFGVTFNNDGTKVFIAGDTTNSIYEYTLSDPYRISSAASPVSLSVSALGGVGPRSVSFNSTGLKMYVTNSGGTSASTYTKNAVFEYNLLSAYSITGATLSGEQVPASYYGATSSSGLDLFFSSDGLNYYIIQTGIIYQFTMSTAWTVSTATYSGKSLNISSQTAYGRSLSFDGTGTKLLVNAVFTSGQITTSCALFQYTLGTPWDLATATFSGTPLQTYSVVSQVTDFRDIWFRDTLGTMYVCDGSGDSVYEYTLGTPGNITTATYSTRNLNASGQTTLAINFRMSSDGTKGYVLGYNNSTIFQYTLSTPWDLSSATYSGISLLLTAQVTNPESMEFSSDGTKLFVGLNSIYTYNLGTAWDLSTAVYASTYSGWGSLSPAVLTPIVAGMRFSTDGLKLYIMNTRLGSPSGDSGYLQQFTLGVAYDFTTITYTGYRYFARGYDSQMRGFYLSPDQTTIYQGGSSSDLVYTFRMATAGDLNTLLFRSTDSASLKNFNVTTNFTNTCVRWSSDGLKLFVLDTASTSILQIATSVAYDINSLVNVSTSYSVGANKQYFTFDSSGSNFYICTEASAPYTIQQYVLSSPFDITTSSITANVITLASSNYFGVPRGVFLSSSDSRIYYNNDTYNVVHEFRMSVAGDISTAEYTAAGVLPLVGTATTQSEVSGGLISSDGNTFIALYESRDVRSYTLSTPYDLSTAAATYTLSTTSQTTTTTECLGISSDGYHLLVGDNNSVIYHYVLGTAWDLSTAVYSGDNYDLNFRFTTPTGATYNADGSKLYFVDWQQDYIFELKLPTPYTISNAVYGATDIFITTNFASWGNIRFDSTGTKLAVLDDSSSWADSGAMYSYTLTTPWDINSITLSPTSPKQYSSWWDYNSISQSLNLQDIYVKPDGTAAYMLSTTDIVYAVSLTYPNQISQAVYSGINFSTASQSTSMLSLTLSSDGARMYTLNNTSGIIYQYNLSVPWDITTAAFIGSLNVSAQDSAMRDLEISADGLKIYVAGRTNDRIYEYNLGVAYTISSGTYSGVNLSVSPQETSISAMCFGNNGQYLYIYGIDQDRVLQYTLSTPWNLSTAAFSGKNFNVVALVATSFGGMQFSSDGYTLFLQGPGYTYQLQLSTAWDISTAATVWGNSREDFSFNDDGSKIYLLTNGIIRQFDLGTPYDIATAQYGNNFLNVTWLTNFGGYTPNSISWNTTGTELTVQTRTLTTTFELSVAWDISTAILQVDGVRALVNPDNIINTVKKMEFDSSGNLITQYYFNFDDDYLTISKNTISGGDINNFNQISEYTKLPRVRLAAVSGSVTPYSLTTPSGIFWGDNGNKLFIINSVSDDRVYLFDAVGEPYSTKNLYSTGYSFTVSPQTTTPSGLIFNSTGTRMYTCGSGGNAIHQFNLSTAWDIRTASWSGTSFSVAAQGTTPSDLRLKSDDTKLYVLFQSNDTVFEYTLATPGELSSATYSGSSLNTTAQSGGRSIYMTFNSTGSRLYVYGDVPSAIYQYNLATPWTLSSATYSSLSSSVFGGLYGLQLDPTDTILTYGYQATWIGLTQQTLTIPSEISSITNVQPAISSTLNTAQTKAYFSSSNTLYEYDLITPGDFTTLEFSNTNPIIGGISVNQISITPDSNRLTISTADKLYGLIFNTTGDVTTLQLRDTDVYAFQLQFDGSVSYTFTFSSDGFYLYAMDRSYNTIYQYTLTTPWDINTMTYTGNSYDTSAVDTNIFDINLSTDGTKLYILAGSSDTLYQYTLSTPYDISSATYDSILYDFTVDGFFNMTEVEFKPDGTKLFAVRYSTTHEYTLSTPWDISTMASTGVSFNPTPPVGAGDVVALAFSSDGSIIYVLDAAATVYQYTLTAPYTLPGATYSGLNKDFSGQDTDFYDLQVNNDECRIWLLGATKLAIFQYSM